MSPQAMKRIASENNATVYRSAYLEEEHMDAVVTTDVLEDTASVSGLLIEALNRLFLSTPTQS
jgi:hypothetical protein